MTGVRRDWTGFLPWPGEQGRTRDRWSTVLRTRLAARIDSEREERASALAWIWRLVPVFSMIVLLLGLYAIFSAPPAPADLGTALLDGSEESMLVDFLTGTAGG